MKKLSILCCMISIVSACKKDRTCTCTGPSINGTETIVIMHATKNQAQANCLSTTQTANGNEFTKTCELK